MRLIDADALCNECIEELILTTCEGCVVKEYKLHKAIEAEPVKHATWELVEYKCTPLDTDQTLVCTHCGFAHQNDAWFNRCPNCGARMDGED